MKRCACGNEEDYNFALNIGLCNGCIGEKLEQLEQTIIKVKAENQRLVEVNEVYWAFLGVEGRKKANEALKGE